MDKKDEEFLKRIQATFRIEAEDHLRELSSGLIELEKTHSSKRSSELIETMFREIHSLKGAARSVDQKDIESLCHPLENLFSRLKRHEISLSPDFFDILYKTIDGLTKLVSTGKLSLTPDERQFQNKLIRQLKETAEDHHNEDNVEQRPFSESRQEGSSEDPSFNTDTETGTHLRDPQVVRIPISKIDPLLFQAEEMIQAKISLDQRIKELQDISNGFAELKNVNLNGQNSKPSGSRENETVAENMNLTAMFETQLSELTLSMKRDQYALNRMVNDHLEEVKHVLMLPVSTLVESFPLMVREISRQQNKVVDFTISGAEMEIDKRILDELKDPLIHLIRNSIDHGIGSPGERALLNKKSNGVIKLGFAAHISGFVEITLSDDGKGINSELLIKEAIKTGYLTPEAAQESDPKEIISLIYNSGISTSPIITDISGRGLGLSIVREKIEKLNGRISVETEANAGTTFRLLLPVTMATFRSLLVKTEDDLFMLPAINVERVLKINAQEIKTVENRDTIRIDNRIILVADLGGVLGVKEKNRESEGINEPGFKNSGQIRLVVLVLGENIIAVKVDEIIEEKQVLVKGLGKLLKHVKNISGATVLGNGRVVPILNVSELIKSVLSAPGKMREREPVEKVPEKIKKILVAEDSITARTLLKNILETAGYQVAVAVDGTDAFTRARSDQFDLIVSDIDMPRMNGFDLTVKIRKDTKISEIPVVLVTALESREDRERGIEVGADAYVIKSSFDQANLLKIIKKLI
jgi:two-component system, chemotaxis family, sensor kinase CheA